MEEDIGQGLSWILDNPNPMVTKKALGIGVNGFETYLVEKPALEDIERYENYCKILKAISDVGTLELDEFPCCKLEYLMELENMGIVQTNHIDIESNSDKQLSEDSNIYLKLYIINDYYIDFVYGIVQMGEKGVSYHPIKKKFEDMLAATQ